MHANIVTIVFTMLLSGGSILHQVWNLEGENEIKGGTAVKPKHPSNLSLAGKSAIEMIIEILKGLSKAIINAYSNFVDGFKSLFNVKEKTSPPSTTAKIKKKVETVSSFFAETSGKKTDRSHWSDLKSEVNRAVDIILDKTTELIDFVSQLKENEIISILWTMMTGQDYIVFYAGVVVPMIFPQVYPLMGVLFWTLVACLQYLVGYKNTQLQKHLGWKQTEAPEADESNRESGENEAEGLASHEIPAEQGVVEDNAIGTVEETIEEAPQSPDDEETIDEAPQSPDDEETIEEAPQSPDDVEIPPTPFLHVAAPAKSVPTVNPDEQQQQSDAIWRNCNSETECKGRENTRADGRHPTRRERVGLHVHDIRRVAPPIDATQAVRHAIEEVELRRQAKLAAASLLDEDESYDFPYEVAGDSKVDDPETEDFMEELSRSTEEDKENRKMVVEPWKGELGDAAAVVGGESKRAEKDTAGENSFERKIDGEEQRERVKSKIRSVQAELHELKVLSESVNTEDLD